MLSIIVKSFLIFGQKNAFHINFKYEYYLISLFQTKIKDFRNHLKLIIGRVE